jgi:RNA polymerase sigma-70 factor (ECF subfamily)
MWLDLALGDELGGIVRREGSASPLQDQVAQLFEDLREDVYRYLLTIGLYPPQAQEATQEVFLRLYTTLKKGERIDNHRGWIFRVAHNLGLKSRVRQEREAPFDPQIEARIESLEPNPEREALDRERDLRFHRAMEGLSEQQRRCLTLRLEGLRYPEIGSALGISASAVGEFLRRAMVRLRKAGHE